LVLDKLWALPATAEQQPLDHIKSKNYLKFYNQKNEIHEGDREKSNSIAKSLNYTSLKSLLNFYPFKKTLIKDYSI
jgi:hypothetical protein